MVTLQSLASSHHSPHRRHDLKVQDSLFDLIYGDLITGDRDYHILHIAPNSLGPVLSASFIL
jgi:hypothetical protein